MGIDRKRPPLPAPTESSAFQTSDDTETEIGYNDSRRTVPDVATDISRRTDRTSVSIPEDGSPVTINTTAPHKPHGLEKLRGQHSQTSLLIEYFEGGKDSEGGSRRPSVRVRVTPSKKKKGEEERRDHVQITETKGKRSASYTRRIPLGSRSEREAVEPHHHATVEEDISNPSALELNLGRYPPVDIEVMHRDQGSDLSSPTRIHTGPTESRLAAVNMSEISSMPGDSMLDAPIEPLKPSRRRSKSAERNEGYDNVDTLKAPQRRRSRSLSRERMVARKAVEKFEKEAREARKQRHASKGRSRSISAEQLTEGKARRRSSKTHDKEDYAKGDGSLLTGSNISKDYSMQSQSNVSNVSSTNPKLLRTVEDAIRRLILPEITALKEEQQSGKHNRRSYATDSRGSVSPISTASREELVDSRRSSRQISDPKNRGPKLKLNGDTIKGKHLSRREKSYESDRVMSDETVVRDEDTSSRRRSYKEHTSLAEKAAAAAGVGGLTHAALKDHDSSTSLDKRERRKKRSKSHSRGTSHTDSVDVEQVFAKHEVPPMPMRSELTTSDQTRESILSERSSTPTEQRHRDIRDFAKAGDREMMSGSSTPTRSPVRDHVPGSFDQYGYDDDHYEAGRDVVDSVHLKKEPLHPSLRNVNQHDHEQEEEYDEEGLGLEPGTGYSDRPIYPATYDDPNFGTYGYRERRGLSPIQSVASFEERGEAPPNRKSMQHERSDASLSTTSREKYVQGQESFDTLSSGTAAHIRRHSQRPKPVNFETANETLETIPGARAPREYRDSVGDDSFRSSEFRDSLEVGDLNTAQEVRAIGAKPELVNTPIGVESAVASLMEPSTVAGSNLSAQSQAQSVSRNVGTPLRNRAGAEQQEKDMRRASVQSLGHGIPTPDRGVGSPLKREIQVENRNVLSPVTKYYERRDSLTPSRERGAGYEEKQIDLSHSAIPTTGSPIPEIGHGMDASSEISTNPSEIRGPGESQDHWEAQYSPTKQEHYATAAGNDSRERLAAQAKKLMDAAAFAGAGAAITQAGRRHESEQMEERSRDLHTPAKGRSVEVESVDDEDGPGGFTPYVPDYTPLAPFQKDEGYHSGYPHHESVGARVPDNRNKDLGLFQPGTGMSPAQERYGTSPKHGIRAPSVDSIAMPSPLYDNSTGQGLDRIQSKDIVALMDHLTVRDAQRNARDTEILVTLVSSAAEMRNSFEAMKRFIADEDDMLIEEGGKQHAETRKAIGGPRPQPSKMMSRATSAEDDHMADDIPTKRRNVFRRALKGLGGGSKQDLSKIEEMLMQLLDEVGDIKTNQEEQMAGGAVPARGSGMTPGGRSSSGLQSYEALRDTPQDGYMPEGQAGTSSSGNRSMGYSSTNSSRPGNLRRGSEGTRHNAGNRVSTVIEGNEDEDAETPLLPHEQDVLGYENTEAMLTPTREIRGASLPAAALGVDATQARQSQQSHSYHHNNNNSSFNHNNSHSQSYDNTPQNSGDKRKHHRSTSSSFFPKISRWSKTTASSAPDAKTPNTANRASGRPVSDLSRSASDLGDGDGDAPYPLAEHYDPTGADRLRSKTSLSNGAASSRGSRPPSPLIPSQVASSTLSQSNDGPRYQAHRDSLNLQHPQPRQGPTARFQNHLEREAALQHQTMGSSPSQQLQQQGATKGDNGFAAFGGGGGSEVDHFGNMPGLARNRLSGVSAATANQLGSSPTAEMAPARPPKIRDEGPLVPAKVPIEATANVGGAGGGGASFAERTAEGGSFGGANGQMPKRKPTGPRPIVGSGSYSPQGINDVKRNRYRASPNHVEDDEESITF